MTTTQQTYRPAPPPVLFWRSLARAIAWGAGVTIGVGLVGWLYLLAGYGLYHAGHDGDGGSGGGVCLDTPANCENGGGFRN